MDSPLPADLAYAWGAPPVRALVRQSPDDFMVTELPLLAPVGSGEHAWLELRKRNRNTEDVARLLARVAGVPARAVSYAGLKDRRAVTTQWFSVHLAGLAEPDWTVLEDDELQLLQHARHTRKLRRGALKGNRFRLRLRNVRGDRAVLEQRLERIRAQGVPNYFGEQRFGRDAGNLQLAARLFAGARMKLSQHRRGLALSAARAWLFNAVLSQRVADRSWNRALAGEALLLAGSNSFFVIDTPGDEERARVASCDVHPSGPLHGRGPSPLRGTCRELESTVLDGHEGFCRGLEAAGLQQARRSLRLVPAGFAWHWPLDEVLDLSFTLPAGCFATSVLRELADTRDPP